MSATAILQELAGLGVRIEHREGHLRFTPAKLVRRDLAQQLKVHKAEIIAALTAADSVDSRRKSKTPDEESICVNAATENAPIWPADLGTDWVLRTDATGRLGWEAPHLPKYQRWWAR